MKKVQLNLTINPVIKSLAVTEGLNLSAFLEQKLQDRYRINLKKVDYLEGNKKRKPRNNSN